MKKGKLTKRDDDPVIKDIAFVDDIIDGEHIADDAITSSKIAEGARAGKADWRRLAVVMAVSGGDAILSICLIM